jgi:hypothetical protein
LTDEAAAGLTATDMVNAMLGGEAEPPAAAARPAGADSLPAALTVRGLSVPDAASDVSFDVGTDEIAGLAGLEGDGPTVVLDALWGRRPKATGEVRLPSASTRLPRSAAAVSQGVALIPSDRKRLGLMLDKTVWENVTAAQALTNVQGPAILRPQRLREIARHWVEELRIGVMSTPASPRSRAGTSRRSSSPSGCSSTRPCSCWTIRPVASTSVLAQSCTPRCVDSPREGARSSSARRTCSSSRRSAIACCSCGADVSSGRRRQRRCRRPACSPP